MDEVYIKLVPAISQTRVVEKARRSGNEYEVFVREDFNSSSRNDLEDLAKELKRAGLTLNVREKRTEDDLRKLIIGSGGPVRI